MRHFPVQPRLQADSCSDPNRPPRGRETTQRKKGDLECFSAVSENHFPLSISSLVPLSLSWYCHAWAGVPIDLFWTTITWHSGSSPSSSVKYASCPTVKRGSA